MGLDEEYKPPQPSLLMAKVVFPIYDSVVQYYPRWWTPNGITLFGITSTLLASAIAFSCMPQSTAFDPAALRLVALPSRDDTPYGGVLAQFVSRVPYLADMRIVLALVGFLNLVYCVADNTDGRQARRLKLSSAIGEYLDHGLDCVTSLLSTFTLIYCIGLPANVAAAGVALVSVVTCVSHILNFENGILIWGNSYASVDEAMLAFAFTPLVPTLLPGLTTWRVPFLWELKALDLAWFCFLLAQVQVIYNIVGRKPAVGIRAPNVFLIFTVFLYASYVPTHSAAFTSTLGAVSAWSKWTPLFSWLSSLSYPAIWTINFASVASILIHIPIAAKCLKAERMEPWPLGLVLIHWFVFASAPVFAAWLGIWFHTFQILVNIKTIIKAKRAH